MRIIAGPNGSGKSTLIELLSTNINIGVYVNADNIEAQLKTKPILHFDDFKIKTTATKFAFFIAKKGTIGTDFFKKNLLKNFSIESNILSLSKELIDSYLASLIADFIRNELIQNKLSFSFETVMSHPSKVATIQKANKKNYSTYLYFIATNNPSINFERIEGRIKKGGHAVNKQKAIERYKRSIALLPKAINKSYRAYIFDNTVSLQLLCEFKEGKILKEYSAYPDWFKNIHKKYLS